MEKLNGIHQSEFLSLEQHSLWANRHTSPEARAKFDQQYGLVLRA
jgi:hypothetical protein